MISLGELTYDPDLGQCVTIIRTTGSFQQGGWRGTEAQVQAYGIVTIASAKDLQQLPEGDRVRGSLMFVTETPIYTTSAAGSQISDEIIWNGERYRVQQVEPWTQYGMYVAVLVRMAGN
ncbi:MAG TPA: hypothetical protein VN736_00405 [Candidatus Limnocylindrales bacterium]|nr:hypothetical protein [Candidatus Limnocylindrales bacterium]